MLIGAGNGLSSKIQDQRYALDERVLIVAFWPAYPCRHKLSSTIQRHRTDDWSSRANDVHEINDSA